MAVSFLSRAAILYARRCAVKGSHPYQYSISKDGLKKRFSSDGFGERNNIILIGSPGCGKTTVGRILGQRLGRPVVDFDNDYLESYWGMTVAEKLSAVGQESFLAAESEALLNLDLKDSVLSLSGSSPMNRPAMQHAAQSGVVVFLDVDSRDIAQRLHRMKVDRIVGQRPGVSTLDLLAYRQQFYEGAYDVRILCERFQNADDIGEKVLTALSDHQKRHGYVSTRSDSKIQESAQPYKAPDFLDVVLQGLADDAGLYVPNREPPHLTREEWTRLLGCTYQQRALRILEKWIHPRDFHPSSLATAVERAYSLENFQSESVVPVAHLQDNQYIMEVFHGPTASFKDAALQLMPQFFTQAVQMKGEKVYDSGGNFRRHWECSA